MKMIPILETIRSVATVVFIVYIIVNNPNMIAVYSFLLGVLLTINIVALFCALKIYAEKDV